MPKFTYKATDRTGKLVSGSFESSDRSTALGTLAKQQLKPISLQVGTESKGKFSLNMTIGGKKVKNDDLVIFTRQLSTMVSAGVPLLRSLNTLQAQSESPALKAILQEVDKDVQSGSPLGDALSKHPQAFNDVYVNMVRAGEAAGILDDILQRIATQQEKSAAMRKKVKSAMTYPIVLLVITLLAFIVLLVFVVPKIGEIIKDLGGEDAELPALTEFLLSVSGAMVNYWYIIIIVIFGGIYALRRWLKTENGKALFHIYVLKVPAVGTIIRKVAVARFARTYASLMSSGVSVLEALKVTSRAVGNKSYERVLVSAAEEVRNGKQLSKSLEGSALFPAIVPQMLAVGEETGQTDTILIKVADFYEEEVDAAIGSVSSIIEPVMIVVMGGMVGLIAVGALGPIFNLSSQIG